MEKLKIGCLGVSLHLIKRVIAPLSRLENTELTAIASRSKVKAERFAKQWQVPKAYGSYEALLDDKEIQAVYIPLPNHLHAEWIKKSADAGKHILCEKPFAMNAAEAADAVSYAEEKGVKIMEAFMYRYHPQWIKALELVSTLEMGEVRTIHTNFSYRNTDPLNIRNIAAYGGGALMDIGCYAISVPRYILQAEPLRIMAHVVRDNELQTDIHTSAMLDFGSARASFTVSTQIHPGQEVKITGSNGEIIVHMPFNTFPDVPARLTITNSLGSREIVFPPADQYGLLFSAFSDAILNDTTVPTPVEDAVNNMKVIDAVWKSAKSGRWEKPE